MTRTTLFITLLSFLLFSCREKDVNCSAVKYKIPCAVAFKGFSAAELDTIFVSSYKGRSGFTQFIRTDTFRAASIQLSADTAFAGANKQPFTTLNAETDYRINIPASSVTFAITDVHYRNDTMIYWTRKRDCGTYGTTVIPPESISVNSNITPTTSIVPAMSWIILKK